MENHSAFPWGLDSTSRRCRLRCSAQPHTPATRPDMTEPQMRTLILMLRAIAWACAWCFFREIRRMLNRIRIALFAIPVAETDKANGVDHLGDAPAFSHSPGHRSNKLRKYPCAKRRFGLVFLHTKQSRGEKPSDYGHATSADSPQPKWRPAFRFP